MLYIKECAYDDTIKITNDPEATDAILRHLLEVTTRRRECLESYNGDGEAVLRDLRKYIGDYSLEDYTNYLNRCHFMQDVDDDPETLPEEFVTTEMMARYGFLAEALSESQKEAAQALYEAKRQQWKEAGYISQWFEEGTLERRKEAADKAAMEVLRRECPAILIDKTFEKAYMPVLRSELISGLGALSKRNKVDPDRGSKGAVFAYKNMRFKFADDINSIGIGADKLLNVAMAKCAQGDHSGSGVPVVEFPLVDYARRLGYKIDDPEKGKDRLKDARRAIDKDLKTLAGVLIMWTDASSHGAFTNKIYTHFIERTGFINGNIHIEFRPEFVEHMKECSVIMQFPEALLGIKQNKYNAYRIGKKLAEVYYNHDNRENGRHDILSVKALLKATDLKTYEELKETDNRNWERRIKERLEVCLDDLKQFGALENWEYCREKKVLLSDDEAKGVGADYNFFINLYITFSLVEDKEAIAAADSKPARKKKAKGRRTGKPKKRR